MNPDYGAVVAQTINNAMLEVIGRLLNRMDDVPEDAVTASMKLVWRTGYQNAMSDLVAELYPESPGRRRLSIDELHEQDIQRHERHDCGG